MFKVNNKDARTTSLTSLLLTLNIFHPFFSVPLVAFELVKIFAMLSQKKPKLKINIHKITVTWFLTKKASSYHKFMFAYTFGREEDWLPGDDAAIFTSNSLDLALHCYFLEVSSMYISLINNYQVVLAVSELNLQ